MICWRVSIKKKPQPSSSTFSVREILSLIVRRLRPRSKRSQWFSKRSKVCIVELRKSAASLQRRNWESCSKSLRPRRLKRMRLSFRTSGQTEYSSSDSDMVWKLNRKIKVRGILIAPLMQAVSLLSPTIRQSCLPKTTHIVTILISTVFRPLKALLMLRVTCSLTIRISPFHRALITLVKTRLKLRWVMKAQRKQVSQLATNNRWCRKTNKSLPHKWRTSYIKEPFQILR